MPADGESTGDHAEDATGGEPCGDPGVGHPFDLEDRVEDDPVGAERETEGQGGAEEPGDESLHEEGAADVAIGRTHETHDLDLVSTSEDRQADRRADDDDRDGGEGAADDDGGGAGDPAEQVDLVDPLPAVLDLLDERIGADAGGDVAHDRGRALPRTESDLDRSRKGIDVELREVRTELGQLFLRDLQGVLPGDVVRIQDLRVGPDLREGELDGVGGRIVAQIGDDLDARLHGVQNDADVVRDDG